MAKKVIMKKYVNNALEVIHPQTQASNVLMSDNSTSLQSAFDTLSNNFGTLQTDFNNLKALLNTEQVYITDSNNNIIYDDENTGLVAVY